MLTFSGIGVAGVVSSLAVGWSLACTSPRSTVTNQEREAIKSGFDSAATLLMTGWRHDDVAAVLSVMAADVIVMPPNEPILTGTSGVRAWYERLVQQIHTDSLLITHREVNVNVGVATEVGEFAWFLVPVAGGSPSVERGHYVQLWHREPAGRWVLDRELWNSILPLSPPSE